MELTETLAREATPEGEEILLLRRDSVYTLRINGMELMTSRAHGSEEALARLACAALADRPTLRALVAGLGFGYTLRATLDCLPRDSTVVVCEVLGCVLDWNRGSLGELAGRPLDDPRVRALHADVQTVLGESEAFDAIMLDVDNGPWGFTLQSNVDLYSVAGVDRLARSLTPAGVLAVWSSEPSPEFAHRLQLQGFEVRVETVRAGAGGRAPRYTIFIAVKP